MGFAPIPDPRQYNPNYEGERNQMANIAKTTVALTIAVLFLAIIILPMIQSSTESITDENIKAILDVIPLIFGVGILMAGAYMLFGKSYR